MKQIEIPDEVITARLRLVSELNRLCHTLRSAKLITSTKSPAKSEHENRQPRKTDKEK
jgi:hypothetical protein